MATPVTEAVRKNPDASGLAVIISNDYNTTPWLENLTGTVKDGEKINSAFQFLKFATILQRNVTRGKLMQILRDISQYPGYPRSYKCIAFVFSGHGLDANQLYTQDGQLITVWDIVETLLPKRAPQIGSIPKLFFIDACRGNRKLSEEAIVVARHGSSSGKVQETLQKGGFDATLHIPPEGNFLIAYSTMPDYQSYELKGEGGIWMTSLAEKLRTSSESIQNILSETNRDLIEMFQSPDFRQSMMQPEYISRLHGSLYLHPEGSARAQVPPTLPSRQGQSGHYRGVLNTMYQDGVITKPEIVDIEHRSEGGGVTGYTGIIKFKIGTIGRKMEFRGHGGSKQAAHENAAQRAVNVMQTIMATSSSTSMGSTNNASTPLSTKSGVSPPKVMPPTNTTTSPPRTVIPTQTKVMSPTKAMSPPRTAVTILKEYCEKERLPEPLYSETPQDVEQHFQYKVVVTVTSARMTAIGNVCGSKQQAKQSAAQSALQKLRIL